MKMLARAWAEPGEHRGHTNAPASGVPRSRGRLQLALVCPTIAILAALVNGCGSQHITSHHPTTALRPTHAARRPSVPRHRPGARPAEPRDQATVARVLAAHRQELFHKWPGVVGFGIGSVKLGGLVPPSEKAFIIVVFLRSASDMPAGSESLAGIPVRFEVTGTFTTQ